MAEDAGAADLISGGRLQLGISRGSPEQVVDGFKYFGYDPGEGNDHAGMAREHTRVFLDVIDGAKFAEPNRARCSPTRRPAGHRAAVARPARPDLVGRGHAQDRRLGRRAGHEPDELDASHRGLRRPVPPAPGRADPPLPRGVEGRRPRAHAAHLGQPQHLPDRQRHRPRVLRQPDAQRGPVGFLEGGPARFGKTYAGEVEQLVKELAEDEAIAAADTLLLTIPNQLGVDYNAHLLDSIVRYVAPELGWR